MPSNLTHASNYDIIYPGSFILMNTQQQPKLMTIAANPTNWRRILLSLGVLGLWVWSRIIIPAPPRLNMKLLARPSMMYCPLTLKKDF